MDDGSSQAKNVELRQNKPTPRKPQVRIPTKKQFHEQQGRRAKFLKDLEELKAKGL